MLALTVDKVFGCVLADKVDREGYGLLGDRRAHVVVWERTYGPVDDGHELDHVCRRRNCCAIQHLEQVTRSENELRKSWSYRARKKACSSGHVLAETGMVTPEGGRVCRKCNSDATPGVWGD